jgi:hypothetical protein
VYTVYTHRGREADTHTQAGRQGGTHTQTDTR